MILRDRPSTYDSSSLFLSSSYNLVLPQSSMCRARRGLTTSRSSSPSPVLGMLMSPRISDDHRCWRTTPKTPEFQISRCEKARNLARNLLPPLELFGRDAPRGQLAGMPLCFRPPSGVAQYTGAID